MALLAPNADPNLLVWSSVGCEACRATGYRGRTGVFEALRITDESRRVITRGGDRAALLETCTPETWAPIQSHALALVRNGVTTIEEALRAVRA
jgi:general secretion pathway protein E